MAVAGAVPFTLPDSPTLLGVVMVVAMKGERTRVGRWLWDLSQGGRRQEGKTVRKENWGGRGPLGRYLFGLEGGGGLFTEGAF